MKKIILQVILISCLWTQGICQYSLTKAEGKNGIIPLYDRNQLSYDFSSGTAAFSIYNSDQPSPDTKNDTCFPELPPQNIYGLSLGGVVDNNAAQLHANGKFHPGFDLAAEYVRRKDESKDAFLCFLRILWEARQNSLVCFNEDSSAFKLPDIYSHKFGLGIGANFEFGIESVFAISIIPQYEINSIEGLDKKNVMSNIETLGGADSILCSVFKSEERYFGESSRFLNTQFRIDYSHAFASQGKKESETDAKIGLLASVSYNIKSNQKDNTLNLSLGPSLLAPRNNRQVMAALLFELKDIANAKNTLKDMFTIRFYIGLPITILGK